MRIRPLINCVELTYLGHGVLALALVNLADMALGKPYWGITRHIYLGNDNNLPAWYSSSLLLVGGLLAYECSKLAGRMNPRGRAVFFLLSSLLLFMSLDETARIHETLGSYAAAVSGIASSEYAKHSAWVWVGGPVIVAVFAGFLLLLRPTLASVPASMTLLLIGLALIVIGGVVLESGINFLNDTDLKWVWDVEVILEESLEMAGSLVICHALVLWRDASITHGQNALA